MYRSMGACPPEAARVPRRDPCAVKYLVDLPLIGEEEVEIPLEQLSQDFMASVTRRLPAYLPEIFRDVEPYIEQTKRNLISDAEELIQDTLDRKVRPEIESQKVELIEDVKREANTLLITAGLISLVLVGGVGLSVWYVGSRRR